MKRVKCVQALVMVLCMSWGSLGLCDWEIYDDAVIETGDEYYNVRVYDTPPDHTTVDMTGGWVDGVSTHDGSTFNMSGGEIYTFSAFVSSRVNVSGGYIDYLASWDESVIHVFEHSVAGALVGREKSVINISGGTIKHAGTRESSTINVSGGTILDCLWTDGTNSTINVYGYSLVKAGIGGHYGYGYVSGEWSDRTGFYIDLSGSETYSHIVLHEIPEPGTFVLLAVGGTALIRRRKW